MYKLKILFILLFCSVTITAQENTETIIVDYRSEVKVDLDKMLSNMSSRYRAWLKSTLENEIKNGILIDYTLKTNGEVSIYQLNEKINNAQTGRTFIKRRIERFDKEPTFKYLNKGIYQKVIEMRGMKKYLVQDSLNRINWEITREKSKILNFEVRKATGMLNGNEITAWFAPKLAIKDGPATFSGLPGLILKVDFKDKISNTETDMTIMAVQIDIKEEKINIKAPEGEAITQKEFDEEMKLISEKRDEMRSEGVNRD